MTNIVLCGMMGSGKTTVARALHKIYNLAWVDTDEEIVKEYGQINAIFANLGEDGFRDIESEVTARVAASHSGAVISLGGGCVLRQRNVDVLKKNGGKIYYLRTSPQTVINRVKGDTTRPLLQGDLEERVHSISATRSAIYERAADVIIDTDDKTPEQIAQIVYSDAEGKKQ